MTDTAFSDNDTYIVPIVDHPTGDLEEIEVTADSAKEAAAKATEQSDSDVPCLVTSWVEKHLGIEIEPTDE